MISSMIPPSMFTTLATFFAMPRINELSIDMNYHKLNAYLCGIFNSMTFDYLIRPKIDKNVETYHIFDTPIPNNFINKTASKICELSASLFLANTWHEGMADTMHISNDKIFKLTTKKYIETVSEIDACTGIHYGLTRDEYEHVLNSFKFNDNGFTEDELNQNICWNKMKKGDRDSFMRKFFGEVRKLALGFYDKNTSEVNVK